MTIVSIGMLQHAICRKKNFVNSSVATSQVCSSIGFDRTGTSSQRAAAVGSRRQLPTKLLQLRTPQHTWEPVLRIHHGKPRHRHLALLTRESALIRNLDAFWASHMQCEWWAVSSGPVAGAVGQWPRTVCEDSDGPLGLLVLDEPATTMYTFRGQWT